MNYWEQLVLALIYDHGPRFAGNGSGALSDAAWALQRRGVLKVSYERDGLPYLEFTAKGLKEYLESAAPPHPAPDARTEQTKP